jgi:hypothetical protein
MSKIELISALLLFLLILFSMNMIFANPLKELFNSNINKDINQNINKEIEQPNKFSDNMIYSGSGFLDETYSYPKGDDQPLFFGFSQKKYNNNI